MSGTSTTTNWTFPTFIGWGTANGSNASSVQLPASAPGAFPGALSTAGTGQWNDVAPYFELTEARAAATATVINNIVGGSYSTTQMVGTITAGANESVGESFLVFKSTKPGASSVATGNMTNVQTSMTTASNPFPAAPFYLQIDNEVVFCSATAASNVLTIVRGTNGTTGAAHNQNAGVTLGNPPGTLGGNPNNGDLFAHAGFVALALNSGDSIQFTWQINVTS